MKSTDWTVCTTDIYIVSVAGVDLGGGVLRFPETGKVYSDNQNYIYSDLQ